MDLCTIAQSEQVAQIVRTPADRPEDLKNPRYRFGQDEYGMVAKGANRMLINRQMNRGMSAVFLSVH